MNVRTFVLLIFLSSVYSFSAFGQTCSTAALSDATCDCGCGTVDPACPSAAKFTACQVSHCVANKVPWEHQPHTCMNSACGDGWKDAAKGEACDDKNALASGGCSADCSAINSGYVCGEGASGCQLASGDSGVPIVDAGTTTTDAGVAPMTDAGSLINDAGPPETDAGTPSPADAGSMSMNDAGFFVVDGGGIDGPKPVGGCNMISSGDTGVIMLGIFYALGRRRQIL